MAPKKSNTSVITLPSFMIAGLGALTLAAMFTFISYFILALGIMVTGEASAPAITQQQTIAIICILIVATTLIMPLVWGAIVKRNLTKSASIVALTTLVLLVATFEFSKAIPNMGKANDFRQMVILFLPFMAYVEYVLLFLIVERR